MEMEVISLAEGTVYFQAQFCAHIYRNYKGYI